MILLGSCQLPSHLPDILLSAQKARSVLKSRHIVEIHPGTFPLLASIYRAPLAHMSLLPEGGPPSQARDRGHGSFASLIFRRPRARSPQFFGVSVVRVFWKWSCGIADVVFAYCPILGGMPFMLGQEETRVGISVPDGLHKFLLWS